MRTILKWKNLTVALIVLSLLAIAVPMAVSAAGEPDATADQGCTRSFPRLQHRFQALLDDLVGAGIISDEQSGEIKTFAASRAETGCVARHLLGPVEIIDTTADLLGMNEREVLQQLRAGSSLSDIAAVHGVSNDQLQEALLAAANENGDWYLSQGRFSEEAISDAIDAITARLDEIISNTDHFRGEHAPL